MARISIIMSTFIDKIEKLNWFKEAVDSILVQNFSDLELIIIDDNSPIKLPNLPNDNRIKLFRNDENLGPSVSRNTGVYVSVSELILPFDSDDVLFPNALESLYNEWAITSDKFVYGNLTLYKDGKSKELELQDYDFELSLNPKGAIPVVALHSKKAHIAAGGWKDNLKYGLEDVEYWIACGLTDTCGKRIDKQIFQYRKHQLSRTHNMRFLSEEGRMRREIATMYKDVYGGTIMCGCSGSRTVQPNKALQMTMGGNKMQAATTANISPDNEAWVEYIGPKLGGFGVVGPGSGISYGIKGTGHKFKIDRRDLERFLNLDRGIAFEETGSLNDTPKAISLPITIPAYAAPKINSNIRQLA